MRIETSVIHRWRKYKESDTHLFVDITRKSGDHVFAPSSALLNAFKYKGLDKEDYRMQYLIEMRRSYRENRERWEELLNSDKIVVLACYCPAGQFCHRLLLTEIFKTILLSQGQTFDYLGEITT